MGFIKIKYSESMFLASRIELTVILKMIKVLIISSQYPSNYEWIERIHIFLDSDNLVLLREILSGKQLEKQKYKELEMHAGI